MKSIFPIRIIIAALGLVAIFCAPLLSATHAESADVIVIGDTRLKPVNEIIAGIRETIGFPFEVYDVAQVKGRLKSIVEKERATVIVALGKDAIDETAHIPPTVAVIYDLVIRPPLLNRPNTTGFYMATPVTEYIELINRYLPSIKRLAVIGTPELMAVVNAPGHSQVRAFRVKSPFELVSTVEQFEDIDGFLLLPDVSLLTASAVDAAYLQSYKKGIPLLGVSERHVKQGALLALVFDAAQVGRQIGEKAYHAARGVDMGQIAPAPSQKFDLFLNLDTARRMGIDVPADLIKRARRVYP